jgi:hypothetical protein
VPVFAEEYRCVTVDQRAASGNRRTSRVGLVRPRSPPTRSHFERVGAAGHSTYFEGPDVFNREVGVFLKEHRP